VKRGMLYLLLLLSGCLNSDDAPTAYEYALTWTCQSPGGCERTEEVEQIDRMERGRRNCHFTSTQNQEIAADATLINSNLLPAHCDWLYFLSLFGYELERSRVCFGPGGFELELAIPNQDPTTYSMWLVEGRDVNLL
jgi:hypothetical protein